MKLIFTVLMASLVFVSTARAEDAAEVQQIVTFNNLDEQLAIVKEGNALIQGNDCLTCHKVDVKLTGPAYMDVSKKYLPEIKNGVVAKLAQKVIKGGNKVWGLAMMAAHPNLKQEDAEKMVIAILSLTDEAAMAEKKKRKEAGTW